MVTEFKPNHALINGEEYYVENHECGVIDKEKAIEMFSGNLKFIGVWFVKDCPSYVFHCSKPDLEKGHKEYLVLKYYYNYLVKKYNVVMMGYNKKEMNKYSTQSAIKCNHCKTIVWSLVRHDYHSCRCEDSVKKIYVDGGMDYIRFLWGEESKYEKVIINHLTKRIKGDNNERKTS